MAKSKYDYYTLRQNSDGSVDVLGWGVYPADSVLAGQRSKSFVDSFCDEAAARKAYPDALGFSSELTEPSVTLHHLPGENDPQAGGMYPDDYSG